MQCYVVPLFYRPVASVEPIHIGAGDSASESGANVPGLAAGSYCKIRSIPTFLFP